MHWKWRNHTRFAKGMCIFPALTGLQRETLTRKNQQVSKLVGGWQRKSQRRIPNGWKPAIRWPQDFFWVSCDVSHQRLTLGTTIFRWFVIEILRNENKSQGKAGLAPRVILVDIFEVSIYHRLGIIFFQNGCSHPREIFTVYKLFWDRMTQKCWGGVPENFPNVQFFVSKSEISLLRSRSYWETILLRNLRKAVEFEPTICSSSAEIWIGNCPESRFQVRKCVSDK